MHNVLATYDYDKKSQQIANTLCYILCQYLHAYYHLFCIMNVHMLGIKYLYTYVPITSYYRRIQIIDYV